MYQVGRDGKLVVPTCPDCGCRLREMQIAISEPVYFSHYGFRFGTDTHDARGCKCPSVTKFFTVRDLNARKV